MADLPPLPPLQSVGRPTARIDGWERVTGRALFTGDVRLPGMLHARVLRSPHPHARIVGIDVEAARQARGVRAVITHRNCAITWSSGDENGRRKLFNNPVRFAGDPVAAVAAVDEEAAAQALLRIRVRYEVLPFVLDPEEAAEKGAVEIHAGGNVAPDRDGHHVPERYRRGDVERGLRESARVFEGRFTSVHLNNAQLERRVSLAHWEEDRLVVHASTQGISNCARDLAADLSLPPEKVRVVCSYMGGGFGNKNQCHDFDLMAAVLSREARAPVRLELSRQEDFVAVHGRWPTRQRYAIGVDADGTLRAIRQHGISGMGAYRKSTGAIGGLELYQCPNAEREVLPVHTNAAVSANFRAPAYPQGVFGIESMMDDAAHQLGIDPVAFRLKNHTRLYHDELPYTGNGLGECLRRGADRFGWRERWRAPASRSGVIRRGLGVAMGAFGARVGKGAAVIRLDSAGTFHVHVGVTDIGTGARTTMALIAAEALGVPLERVRVISGDTERCPYSVGESGSRTTSYTGRAVMEAARDLRRQVEEKGAPRGDAILIASAVTEPKLEGVERYSFAAHFCELEVDLELGGLRVLRYVAAHDSGRIINPLTAESQVKGGVLLGLGMALHEELRYDPATGLPLNAGYYGARVPTHLDAPPVEVVFVESDDGWGPYGAKSLGEPPVIPVVAAVANAFFNATGRRLFDLPFSRRRVRAALL